jgi:hypothetical protein
MIRTIISGFVFAMFLTCSASAAEQIIVKRSEWENLKAPEREAIEKILQDSRFDVTITTSDAADVLEADAPESPLRDLRGVDPQSADWIGKVLKWGSTAGCELGCDASAVGGTTACGALSGGTAAALCGGILNKARPLCKKLCK